jgi:hypothetical protein
MTKSRMSDDAKLAEARARLSVLAMGLRAKFGAPDAAGLLLGAATGLLTNEFGDEAAAAWLAGLADGLRDGADDGAGDAKPTRVH